MFTENVSFISKDLLFGLMMIFDCIMIGGVFGYRKYRQSKVIYRFQDDVKTLVNQQKLDLVRLNLYIKESRISSQVAESALLELLKELYRAVGSGAYPAEYAEQYLSVVLAFQQDNRFVDVPDSISAKLTILSEIDNVPTALLEQLYQDIQLAKIQQTALTRWVDPLSIIGSLIAIAQVLWLIVF